MSRRTALALCAVALLATGCGRRGALEAPPDPKAAAAQSPQAQGPAPSSPIGRGGGRRPAPIKPGNQPFILDAIL